MKNLCFALGLVPLLACLPTESSPSEQDLNHDLDPSLSELAGDPSGNGTYSVYRVASQSVPTSNGSVSTTVCAPSTDGGRTIAAGTTFPLVVISPGFQQGRSQYDSYCRHLATWGFIAIARDNSGGFFPNHNTIAAQTTGVITWAINSAPWKASVDAAKIGVAGHSLGGKTSLLATSNDTRIKAVVAWDPVDSNSPSVAPERMSAIRVPVAYLGETLNGSGGAQPCAPTAENYHQFFTAGTGPSIEVTVSGADHMDFVDNTGCFTCGFCTRGTATDADVKSLTRRTTAAWLLRHLNGDTSMDTYLTGAAMQADVLSGRVSLATK